MPNLASSLIKDQARKLLQRLLDDDEKKSEANQSAAHPQHAVVSAPAGSYDQSLAQSFNSLSVSDQQPPANPQLPYQGPFIGGFHPPINGPPQNAAPPFPSYPGYPPSSGYGSPYTPGPMSMTMQHALQPVQSPESYITPQDTPISTPSSGPSSPPATPNSKPSGGSGTPNKRKKKDSDDEQVQCSGITKANKQCTRMVKVGRTLSSDDDDDAATPERFCHQHSKELLGPSGFPARKNGEFVEFSDWIPEYLSQSAQVALRVEMEKARTPSDVPGYIYTFEIREPGSKTIKLKVGRAVNLVKRIDQWGKQCGSKEPILRGFYPGSVEDDGGSLMKGRVIAGEKAAWCHRLERLIHMELTDLVETDVYLHAAWPKPGPLDESTLVKDGISAGKRAPCADCGQMHKEIFEFSRLEKGKNKAKEWEVIVKPVIERWGRFVDLYL
ncbi:hypothetical protein BDN72DRAFT_885262 [Pluteus cervinus]|uniref:Uncharacterized protein n=1 Tax=Pluteus cervinus TaxID=181527 RepID=A0ACD3BFA2_9AGAR|nr:hypothetical protein BDN72DRAFT_885262 [Pluteus cervinus]